MNQSPQSKITKKLLVVLGSPRKFGNSELLANQIVKGFSDNTSVIQVVRANELHILPCTGCLKCNNVGTCVTHKDGWGDFLKLFYAATHVVIASPIYFHHLPGPLKIVLDRFRSQIQIQMTATGLIHKPRWKSRKKYAFVFSLGDRRDHDALPAKHVLTYWAKLFGATNEDISVLLGTGLAIRKQVSFSKERLKILYGKLDLPTDIIETDYKTNQQLLQNAFDLGTIWVQA
jgi:multimeric flavodoxin WrbA